MDDRRESLELKSKRSRILYEITGLVVILMIASGLLTFFFVNSAFGRLVDKSVDKVIEEQAATIDSGLRYVGAKETEAVMGDLSQLSMDELMESTRTTIETGGSSEFVTNATARMKKLVEDDVLGMDLVLDIILANPPFIPEDIIIVSTDDEYAMQKPPDAVLAAIEEAEAEGKTYVYLEEGIPEIGLDEEYLVSLYDVSEINPLFTGNWGVHFVSMHEAVAGIEEFYASEKTRATWIIALIIGGSVLLVIVITFFILSYLIRTRITQPIDRLSMAAGEVMGGNLDIEVRVHEGSDLEELERAFKELVESIRKIIAKSVGE